MAITPILLFLIFLICMMVVALVQSTEPVRRSVLKVEYDSSLDHKHPLRRSRMPEKPYHGSCTFPIDLGSGKGPVFLSCDVSLGPEGISFEMKEVEK